jgi:hypothetical protein
VFEGPTATLTKADGGAPRSLEEVLPGLYETGRV